MKLPNERKPWRIALWILGMSALLSILVPLRSTLGETHAALVILLLVLGASADLGFVAGMAMAFVGFAALTYFFKTPINVMVISNGLDFLELVAFTIVAGVAARLVTVARLRAAVAEARSRQIEQMAQERAALASEAARARSLAEANRMKDALLAAVSHDLRTPLTAINALASRMSVARDPEWYVVREEVERLTHMVEELLDYSRIRGGSLPVRIETFPAEELLGSVYRECGSRLDRHRLEVDIPLTDDVLAGQFDLALSTRILVNLIENATRHGYADTRILVRVRREMTNLRIDVENEGPTVHTSDRERIFEPFVRATGQGPTSVTAWSSSRVSAVTGVGLGLAIARALSEAQFGSLVLEDAPAPITRFVFRVPIADWSAAVSTVS